MTDEPEEKKRARYAIELAIETAVTVESATRAINELGRLIWQDRPTVHGQYWVRDRTKVGTGKGSLWIKCVNEFNDRDHYSRWQYAGPIPRPMP